MEKINFFTSGDNRGYLSVVENMKDIPFNIQRIFYIYGTKNKSRGNHANINSEFVMIALSGSVEITVDDSKEKHTYKLNKPNEGLYIPKMTWKVMDNFTEDCILLVLSSEKYNKEEYINDYDEFKKEAEKIK